MALPDAFKAAAAAGLFLVAAAPAALAQASANASYVVSLGGTIIANAKFHFEDNGATYTLKLDGTVTGIAQLIASGTIKVTSSGTSGANGLQSQSFDFLTRSGSDTVSVKVQYAGSDVTAFIVDPPIVNNIDRVPLERSQLTGVNDMLAPFLLTGDTPDASVCNARAPTLTGIERFDLSFRFARTEVATSLRTGYQGPVVLCAVKYKPISGHYTTSELTNSLAQDDRILVWYAPLRDTHFFLPYRVLLTTSMGDLSMVLTGLD